MINAIAVDDEPPALDILKSFCEKVDFVTLEHTFTKPSEALRHLGRFPVDLLFLDINMPSLTGLQFYEKAPQNTMVIFTTAYSDFAVQGFNVGAIDYLLKPFTFERFVQAVNRARDYYNHLHRAETAKQSVIYLRADYSLIKVELADILYVEGLQDYLRIHIVDQKPIVVRLTMKGMLEKLPTKDFMRVHRSYIVPLSRVVNVRNKTIDLQGTKIPVGPKYEEEFFKLFDAMS
jgi:DNA-binding LytR/AlgR family response regulator